MSGLPFPNFISTPANGTDVPLAASPQINVDYLRRECGVTLTGLGTSCVLRMELDNGTAANLMLPSGLLTSFKPRMWHGGTMELLHTFVSQQNSVADGVPVIQGGMSLALGFTDEATGVSWSPTAWSLHQVSGNREESIQVELVSESNVSQVKHVITLKPELLNSEILVSNASSSSSLRLVGAAMCHLAMSTPEATYAVGLEGSDYVIRPPFEADFSIIPPDFKRSGDRKSNNLFSKWAAAATATAAAADDVESLVRGVREELEGEEEDNYKHLAEKISRIYTNTPRSFTIMDRGRRNSVEVKRQGFKEVYMSSPGSKHEWYDKYSYICIGHASMLEPVVLKAQTEWRGGLQLWNPNS